MKTFAIISTALLLCSCASQSSTKLFNGKDLQGWNLSVDPKVKDAEGNPADPAKTFYVENGEIIISGEPFGFMYTDGTYSSYDLDVEWAWIGKGTNSGIFMNMENFDSPFPRCVECNLQAGVAGKIVLINKARVEEVQIPEGEEIPFFGVIEPKEACSEKAEGEWNAAHIEVRDGHMKMWINGVLQNECHSIAKSGPIALQSEGGPLRIRKVTLTEIK